MTLYEMRTGLLSAEQIALVLRCTKRTVWRLVKRGQLPRPLRFTNKLVRWHGGEVLAAIEALDAAKAEKQAEREANLERRLEARIEARTEKQADLERRICEMAERAKAGLPVTG